jgi:hypothetical protein
VPLVYDVHPDFGYFCPGPRVRRELRVALVSMLFGMAIGAAIVTIRAGQASETDGISSNARLKSSGTDTWAPGITGPNLQFKNADDAKAEPVEAIKPFPIRFWARNKAIQIELALRAICRDLQGLIRRRGRMPLHVVQD